MVPIEHFVALAGLLFAVGALGMITRRDALVLAMSGQLMMAAATLALVAFARLGADPDGQALAVLAVAVATAQGLLGAGALVAFFRGRQSLDVDEGGDSE